MKNEIRIISGKHKGYKLNVLDKEGLRPTTDRNRETVFNLLKSVEDLSILDLFAGTGILAFECLSRGASKADLVELDRDVYLNLCNTINKLKLSARAYQVNALDFLQNNNEQYDLVFIDPPYAQQDLYIKVLSLIKKHIHKDSLVYVEQSKSTHIPLVGFEIYKEGQCGDCKFMILKKSSLI